MFEDCREVLEGTDEWVAEKETVFTFKDLVLMDLIPGFFFGEW